MDNRNKQFWKTKTLEEMSFEEWESLCDGCGICCLHKIEDQDTLEVKITSVSCQFLNIPDCRCIVYEDRLLLSPDCIKLLPENLNQINWLPQSCAYRRVAEGKDLEWWHPLLSGDPGTVHEAGISVRERAVSGKYVHPEEII